MYLKSLELQGFKSFPDKIRLHFDRGVTAVVGPNGSGKSNIGDAVRWVLGEQSTKTLRGNKMEDVIFSGTKTRKPMGFAVVTLEISNEDGALGEEYGETVSVTRKLFRSGDSEYRINGKSVRLKDINELFMDTGMGKDGYAIIGQGRIAEIVGAKSTDRRDIFEEAAGVSKFRYKKEEAQRRLQAAQENLLRLQDIVSELEARIEPLRRQAEKAKQYVVLAGEQKELEISLWIVRLASMKEKLAALSDELLRAKAEYENAALEVKRVDEQVQESYRQMQRSSVQIEEMRAQMQNAEEETAKLRAGIAVSENDILHCEREIERLRKMIEGLTAQAAQTEQENKMLTVQAQKLKQQAQEITEKMQQMQQAQTSLETDAASRGRVFAEEQAQLQACLVTRSTLQVQQRNTAGTIEDLRAQIAEHGIRQTALRQAYDTQNTRTEEAIQQAKQCLLTFEEAQKARSDHREKFSAAAHALEQSRKAQEQAAFALREKKQRKRLLEDMERNMEGFAGSVRAVLRAQGGKPEGVCGTVAQLIKTDQKYGTALETALGGAMQNIVVTDENAAKRWIRHLAQNRAGRATFLPLTSIKGRVLQENGLERHKGFIALASELVTYAPAYTEIVRNLLGRTAVAADLDCATEIARAYSYRFRIVTLDGQVVNAGGSFTGGSAQRAGGLVTRKAELDALAVEISGLEQQAEKTAQHYAQAQAQSAQMHQEMEQFEQACRIAERQKLEADSTSEKEQYLLKQAYNRVQEIAASRTALQTRIEQQEEQKVKLAQDIQKNEECIKRLETAQAGHQNEQAELQSKRAALTEQIAELRIKQIEVQKDIQSIERDQGMQQLAQQERQTEIQDCRLQIKEQETLRIQKQEQIIQDRAAAEHVGESQQAARSRISQLQRQHDEQQRQIQSLQGGLRETQAALEKYSGEMSRLEERRLAMQNEYDGVVRQLFEQYELSVNEAQAIAKPLEDLAAAQRHLQSLKGQIRALGTVNVAAISEFEEVSARYKLLSGQIQDAQEAKEKLEALIVTLTQEMERIFSESFTIINRHFRTIFKELFGGGEANLVLSDPEHVLESGIEIRVAPPGKVIKNLISLSGGEQSFVAIAIYFAILKLRPSPFCILDEIDAALDEGNVRRYAQYLSNFIKTTQFIIVTHRRSAMEEAGVLYGVTMQKDGISRLLRMEQEEAMNAGGE